MHGDDIMEISRGRYKAIQENLSEAREELRNLHAAIQALDVGHLVQAKLNEMNDAEEE